MMSTGKRLAKRSILGTKVMVPGQDDLFHQGVIQAVKTAQEDFTRYSVRFEDAPNRVFEFGDKDIVGPGFRQVSEVHLNAGQRVFVTHNNREMQGRVVRHDPESNDVLVTIENGEEETVLLKIDDVRLLESRKSARLVNSDTDFSKLADITISAMGEDPRNRKGSKAFEVPRSDYVQIAGSRKRRTSENVSTTDDNEGVMSECSAAMLLMKLSCSPHSVPNPATQGPLFMDLPSPSSWSTSSGASSFRSPTPSPPLSSSVTDEGIVKDLDQQRGKAKYILYQCTFPGCQDRYTSVRGIESHVRKVHLHRPEFIDSDDEEERDHEEEFYYTEVEMLESMKGKERNNNFIYPMEPPSGHMASLSLADHLDMARPAHEDPSHQMSQTKPVAMTTSGRKKMFKGNQEIQLSRSLPASGSIPFTIAPASVGSPGKLIVISPPARGSQSGTTGGKSPNRRPRDGKKCRKVYGLEQRDMWCTQCKWKKACARFGANATEPLTAANNPQTVKAIKF